MNSTVTDAEIAKRIKTLLLIFGTVFFIMGCVFAAPHSRQLLDIIKAFSWQKVPCAIEEAVVKDNPRLSWTPYEINVRYEFNLDGQHFQRDSAGLRPIAFGEYRKALRMAHDLSKSRTESCFVSNDPEHRAVLIRITDEDRWNLTLPLAMALMGLAVLLAFAWAKTLAQLRRVRTALFSILFGAGTLVAPVLMLWHFGIVPFWKTWQARDWPEISCEILTSRLQMIRQNGETFRPDILYRYTIADSNYIANDFDFFHEGKSHPQNDLLDKYPPGILARCRVNPANPAESVLDLRLSWGAAILAGVNLVMLAGGSFGFYIAFRKFPPRQPARPLETGEILLRPARGNLIVCLLFAIPLIIASVQLTSAVSQRIERRLSMTHWSFLFLAAGAIAVMGYFIRNILRSLLPLLCPKPALHLNPACLTPGRDAILTCKANGYRKIERLELELLCHEWNSDVPTPRELYKKTLLQDAEASSKTRAVPISLPTDAPLTVLTKHRGINWSIRQRLKLGNWPEVLVEYPVQVVAP